MGDPVDVIRLGADGVDHGSPGEMAPLQAAGFWRRVVALAADLVVVSLLLRAGQLLAQPLARLDLVARALRITYVLVVPAAYFVLTHGTGGQTLGKRLVRVRVAGASGEPIGYLRALGRQAAWCLSALLLGIGLLQVACRRDRRGLHDRLADTRVVRVR